MHARPFYQATVLFSTLTARTLHAEQIIMKQRIEEVLKLIGVEDAASRSLAAFHLEEIMRDILLARDVTHEHAAPELAGTSAAAN